MFDTLNTHKDVKSPPNLQLIFNLLFYIIHEVFNPIKPGDGGRGVNFARGKFKFKLFLNGLWYEPETL